MSRQTKLTTKARAEVARRRILMRGDARLSRDPEAHRSSDSRSKYAPHVGAKQLAKAARKEVAS